MPSLTNPAAPHSPANGGRGRFQDAIKGPAPLFHKFRSDLPEPFGAASPAFVNSFHSTTDTTGA